MARELDELESWSLEMQSTSSSPDYWSNYVSFLFITTPYFTALVAPSIQPLDSGVELEHHLPCCFGKLPRRLYGVPFRL